MEEAGHDDHGEQGQPSLSTTRYVGEIARILRKHLNMTQDNVGHELGYTGAAVSAMETGVQPGSEKMLKGMDRVLLGGIPVFEASMKYLRREKYPPQFQDFAPLEQRAALLSSYQMATVHGLFQTREYARALITGGFPVLSDQRVEDLVEARLARRALLDREPTALIELIVEESVLRRTIGSAEIMREQLRSLAQDAQRRNVTLQVLPLDGGPECEYAGARGPMTVLETTDHDHLVYLEPQDESLLISDPAKVGLYSQRYAKIRSQALSPRESLGLIEQLAGEQ
ncbi:helix-turn-helix domain-containing protein [Streptomyces daliensis]|uniref:Helix-turn-helix transcriptional regulator n=1 Tax=Streptomyces daliensis TaxID=299421 RepID=A0A8T4INN6_9ACTN|nr:helix-turn-helix transcriptional regulator [Streptomyces daliensis]